MLTGLVVLGLIQGTSFMHIPNIQPQYQTPKPSSSILATFVLEQSLAPGVLDLRVIIWNLLGGFKSSARCSTYTEV